MFINKAVLDYAEYFVMHSMTSTISLRQQKMAATAPCLSDRDVEYLIVLFQNEIPLWDSSSVSYSNAAFDPSVTLRHGQHATGGVTTTTYIPTSRVLPNATCALRQRPLPANACLARPHESSQTDAIGRRQRKQICCCLLSTTWHWLTSHTEDSVSALLAHCV